VIVSLFGPEAAKIPILDTINEKAFRYPNRKLLIKSKYINALKKKSQPCMLIPTVF